MKIPTVQQSVDVQVPNVQPIEVPKAVPGAFGEQVGQALEGAGKQVEGVGTELAQHALRRQYFADEAKNYDLESKFDQALMGKLTSQDDETYMVKDATGQDVEMHRPAGLLLQKGDHAHESAFRFQQYAQPLMQQYISQAPPRVQAQLTRNLDTQYRTRYNEVVMNEAKQTNQANEDRIDQNLQTQANIFPNASPDDKASIITDAHSAIQAGYQRGLYSWDQAQKKAQEFNSSIIRSDILNDNSIQEKESGVLAQLKAGDTGIYSFLPIAERDKMIEESQRRIAQNNLNYKQDVTRTQNVNEDAITAQLADKSKPQPKEEDVLKMMNAGQIKPEFAKALINDLRSTKLKTDRGSATFVKEKDFLMQNDPSAVRIELMRAKGAGEITPEEYNVLNTFRLGLTPDELKQHTVKKSLLESIFPWCDRYAGLKSEESKSRLMYDYMESVNNKVPPDVAFQKALKKEMLILHPGLLSYKESGQHIMDNNGVVKKAKPTIEIEDADDRD